MLDYLGMGISRFYCSMCGMCDIYFNLIVYLYVEKVYFFWYSFRLNLFLYMKVYVIFESFLILIILN